MLAETCSATLQGVNALPVTVEANGGEKGEPRCILVGLPDAVLGSSPCAFIVPTTIHGSHEAAALRPEDERRLRASVKQRLGAVPSRFVVVPALPETYSGKYMRRILRAMVDGESLGDLGALKNPECVEPLRDAIAKGAKSKSGKRAAAPKVEQAPARHACPFFP